MIYTNEDILNMKYNERLNKIQIKKEKRTSKKILKIINKIRANKFITVAGSLFLIFSIINFYLIYSIIKLIQTVNFM